jgi:hypothetical protein
VYKIGSPSPGIFHDPSVMIYGSAMQHSTRIALSHDPQSWARSTDLFHASSIRRVVASKRGQDGAGDYLLGSTTVQGIAGRYTGSWRRHRLTQTSPEESWYQICKDIDLNPTNDLAF